MQVDIYTVIWTVISFLVLYVLLNSLLYKPLVAFMDKRYEKISKGLEQKKDAQEQLEAAQGLMEEKLRQANEEVSTLLRDAKQKDRAAYDEQIRQAHAQSSEMIRQAGQDMKAEEQRQLDEVDAQMPELVCSLAEKILGVSVPVSENREQIAAHLSQKA